MARKAEKEKRKISESAVKEAVKEFLGEGPAVKDIVKSAIEKNKKRHGDKD
jgi:DNA gyrase/topoisomerase IV subunit B